jgi:hypothetical protein
MISPDPDKPARVVGFAPIFSLKVHAGKCSKCSDIKNNKNTTHNFSKPLLPATVFLNNLEQQGQPYNYSQGAYLPLYLLQLQVHFSEHLQFLLL